MRRTAMRPSVDLPQPDSPTSASVSPRAMENETSSTAFTTPAFVLKCFVRCSARSTSVSCALADASVIGSASPVGASVGTEVLISSVVAI